MCCGLMNGCDFGYDQLEKGWALGVANITALRFISVEDPLYYYNFFLSSVALLETFSNLEFVSDLEMKDTLESFIKIEIWTVNN